MVPMCYAPLSDAASCVEAAVCGGIHVWGVACEFMVQSVQAKADLASSNRG